MATTWLPLPEPRPRRRRWLLAPVLALALAGILSTVVIWRADSASRRGDYARAVWWRPDVAIYRRLLGESLLINSPALAEKQLLESVRLNPYDPQTTADLTTVELALGNWNAATTVTRNQQHREPGFDDDWRMANLLLTHGDLPGFWVQVQRACPLAEPEYFTSIVSRSLTASKNDFNRLRQVLPPQSVAAASAYLSAAVQAGDYQASHAGAQWLLGLPAASDPASGPAREQALFQFLTTAWQRWPGESSTVWTELNRAGLIQTPPKTPGSPFLRDADFSPRNYIALRQIVSDPAQPLSAILGWQWSSLPGIQFHEVDTGEGHYPTAAEFIFDGSEAQDAALPDQWLLADGGSLIHVSLAGRMLNPVNAQGLSLQLLDMNQHLLAEIPVTLTQSWSTTQGTFTVPGSGVGAYVLAFHYHRPNGQLPLNNSLLVSALRLQ